VQISSLLVNVPSAPVSEPWRRFRRNATVAKIGDLARNGLCMCGPAPPMLRILAWEVSGRIVAGSGCHY
jgi:hypothetical protein